MPLPLFRSSPNLQPWQAHLSRAGGGILSIPQGQRTLAPAQEEKIKQHWALHAERAV